MLLKLILTIVQMYIFSIKSFNFPLSPFLMKKIPQFVSLIPEFDVSVLGKYKIEDILIVFLPELRRYYLRCIPLPLIWTLILTLALNLLFDKLYIFIVKKYICNLYVLRLTYYFGNHKYENLYFNNKLIR